MEHVDKPAFRKDTRTPEFHSWQSMHGRCNRSSHVSYDYYGGRGITVCPQWASFAQFLADMGPRPEGTSLDRIDWDGNYEPGNCRWASVDTQATNKRPQKIHRARGHLKPAEVREIRQLLADGTRQKEIAERFGVAVLAISNIATGRTFKNVA